ncbi:hypothetical protein NM688_g4706 [Phlebia brevispora]|uniref:Uncharacterized protein n=1 Tax=Phlebia brevispora TaxID=194682 RepID=A0ACC1T2B8_9APHY|nr:hypothetical protein NM688_g4706 [Phlebia brevispora]
MKWVDDHIFICIPCSHIHEFNALRNSWHENITEHGGKRQEGSRLWYSGGTMPNGLPLEFVEDMHFLLGDLSKHSARSKADAHYRYNTDDIDWILNMLGIPWQLDKDLAWNSIVLYTGFLWDLDRKCCAAVVLSSPLSSLSWDPFIDPLLRSTLSLIALWKTYSGGKTGLNEMTFGGTSQVPMTCENFTLSQTQVQEWELESAFEIVEGLGHFDKAGRENGAISPGQKQSASSCSSGPSFALADMALISASMETIRESSKAGQMGAAATPQSTSFFTEFTTSSSFMMLKSPSHTSLASATQRTAHLEDDFLWTTFSSPQSKLHVNSALSSN